jgi:hypothetical protein
MKTRQGFRPHPRRGTPPAHRHHPGSRAQPKVAPGNPHPVLQRIKTAERRAHDTERFPDGFRNPQLSKACKRWCLTGAKRQRRPAQSVVNNEQWAATCRPSLRPHYPCHLSVTYLLSLIHIHLSISLYPSIFLFFILSLIRHRPCQAEHRHAAALRTRRVSTAAAWRCSA